MQIMKDELIKELAEIDSKKFDDLPFHKRLTYTNEAERFIKALNNIRKRKIYNDQ